jgi:hypothetical protein
MIFRRKRVPEARPALAPDGPVTEPGPAAPVADVPAAYPELPGLTGRRGISSGVTVWRSAPPDLVAAWTAARDRHPATGLWPVLVPAEFWERYDDATLDPDADRGDGAAWLAGRAEDLPRRGGPAWRPVPAVTWPDLCGEATELVLVPAAAPWLVPAAIGWDGAVNAEVMGPEHTTVLRRWWAAYGAEPAMLGSDVLVLRVARPPAGRTAALAAATELAAYCPDSVHQGAGDLDTLSETLTAPTWFLWWD